MSDSISMLRAMLQNLQDKFERVTTTHEDQVAKITQAVNTLDQRLQRLELHLDPANLWTGSATERRSVAGPQVANIPELLEPILLHLPMRDLLLSQRVNKTFNAIIQNSAAIQQALFFTRDPEPDNLREIDVRINPLLIGPKSYIQIPLYMSQGMRQEPVLVKNAGWNRHKHYIIDCSVNEMHWQDGNRGSGRYVGCKLAWGRLRGVLCAESEDKVGKSTHGSWRKMYFTQPPLKVMWHHEASPGSGSGPSGDTRMTAGELWPWKEYLDDGTEVDAAEEREERSR